MLNSSQLGFLLGFSAYIIWGFFPIYFYYLNHVSALEILSQRVIWSFVLVLAILTVMARIPTVKIALKSKPTQRALIVSSVLISINWLTFIWAVSEGRVLETSFGYFITPLVSVLLARIFLGETLDYYRLAACVLALIGVIWQLVTLGIIPWVSLILAASFGAYGLVRKQANIDALGGLACETALVLPFALLYWIWLLWEGDSQFINSGISTAGLLMTAGALTAITLLLFTAATKKLSLTVLGFMMYINPSMQFLSGIYFFKESFSTHQFISFCFIWIALIVFSLGAWQHNRFRAGRPVV